MKGNYSNGKIYSIRSYQTDKVYYGSTTQSYFRLSGHKSNFKSYGKGTCSYISSFEIIKFEDAYIELVEDFPCKSKNELEKREGQVIRENEDAVNKHIVGRTQKEYRESHQEQIKNYRDTHKEERKKYKKENAEYISQQNKQYYVDNIIKIKERQSAQTLCECGGHYRASNKSVHLKTKKHKNFFNKQDE